MTTVASQFIEEVGALGECKLAGEETKVLVYVKVGNMKSYWVELPLSPEILDLITKRFKEYAEVSPNVPVFAVTEAEGMIMGLAGISLGE